MRVYKEGKIVKGEGGIAANNLQHDGTFVRWRPGRPNISEELRKLQKILCNTATHKERVIPLYKEGGAVRGGRGGGGRSYQPAASM